MMNRLTRAAFARSSRPRAGIRAPARTQHRRGRLGAALVALSLYAGQAPCAAPPPDGDPIPVPAFDLTNQYGRPVTEASMADRWTLLFFGYTGCPDVCPVTLTVLKRAAGLIAERSLEPPQVVLVTVDPERDTPSRLEPYMRHFDPAFTALTGETSAVHGLVRGLGATVTYRKYGPDAERELEIEGHTASLLLIGPDARVHARLPAPHAGRRIAADYEAVLARFRAPPVAVAVSADGSPGSVMTGR